MLVCYNTFIIFALHPTCNKCVMGIKDKVSLIILIVVSFIREKKEGSVLSRPLFVCVGHPLGSDERLYDRERRRSRFFFVTAIRFPRFRRGCVVLRACFLDLFLLCVLLCVVILARLCLLSGLTSGDDLDYVLDFLHRGLFPMEKVGSSSSMSGSSSSSPSCMCRDRESGTW